jgi:hypothetical protein
MAYLGSNPSGRTLLTQLRLQSWPFRQRVGKWQ